MATVSAPDRRDPRRMAGNRQPIMNGGPDPATSKGRFAFALMPRNQQQNAVSGCNGSLQCPIDRLPGPVQRMAVEVEHPVRFQPTSPYLAVPATVQRGLLKRFEPLGLAGRRARRRYASAWRGDWLRFGGLRPLGIHWIARKRPDRCGNFCPERRFFSGQAAHGPPLPWVARSAPGPSQTCRLRFAWRLRRRPRMYRRGWRP